MSKALAIKKSALKEYFPTDNEQQDVLELFVDDETAIWDLDNSNFELLDRPDCETNYDYLQIIPYVTLYNPKEKKYFVYDRPTSGGEARLHKKSSIGLGGHIEALPTKDKPFEKVVMLETWRELREEVNMLPMAGNIQQIDARLATGGFHVFTYQGDDVGKVHLCISICLSVLPDFIGEPEQLEVQNARWLTYEEITNQEHVTLETWSSVALEMIKKDRDAEEQFTKEWEEKGLF